MKLTINTELLGAVTFTKPGGCLIYCDMGDPVVRSGWRGEIICEGGRVGPGPNSPSIRTYTETPEVFEQICKSWWAQYRRRHEE